MASNRRLLSFFSGALGLDLGLECAGWRAIAANEHDPVACATIRANRPDLRLFECDIRELSAPALLEQLSIEPGDLELVCGGPPCQAFSTAGRRLGLNDDRGNVFLHFLDLIQGIQPQNVIIENVRGLLSCPIEHRKHSDRTVENGPLKNRTIRGALRHIVKRLRDDGYEVSFNLYNTANFGVPQIRERLILFGTRSSQPVPHLWRPPMTRRGTLQFPTLEIVRRGCRGSPGCSRRDVKFPERRLA